ncbi:MAG: EpsG family protein [Ruminococcaceae bacterium]|nr:EpsG family protein [Oscillospiraceae bacterium]
MFLYILMMLGILFAGLFRSKNANPIMAREDSMQMPVRRRHSYYAIFILFMLWIFLAFRGSEIGSDTKSYVDGFGMTVDWVDRHKNDFWSQLFAEDTATRYETGYIVLNRLIARFTEDHQWLLGIVATFCMYVCYRFIMDESHEIMISLFLFVSLRFYYFFMSGIRQAIAICICLIAYRFIKKRQLIPFVLLVLLAMQFHVTAVVFLVAYPISFFKFNVQNMFWMGIIGVICFLLFNSLLNVVLGWLPEYYSHYTSTERFDANKVGNILVAIIQLIFLTVSVFSKYGMERKERNVGFVSKEFDEASFMKFMLLISIVLSIVSLRATTLDRLFYYFWIFSIVCIPNMLQGIERDSDRMTLNIGTVVFTFLYNITLLYFRPEWNNITPYLFFWQE